SSGEFNITQPRAPIINLDSLPWPDLEGFEFETYLKMQKPNDSLYLYIDDEPRFFPIISSRGCPFNCTFCYHPLTQKYRSRSVSDFISEIKHVVEKYNVNNLSIFDELISADPKRLFEICEELKKLPKRVHWMCQLRVDMVNEEMLAVLKDAGCFLISFGFESVSNKVLKSMNKHIKREQIERAMKLTRKAGIGMQGYFIFGDPAETTETAHETLAFWRQYKDYHITMGYIRPYPGSVLWTRAMKEGRINSFEDQISFLEQCTYAPPNMSQMDGKEWFDLQKNVQKEILLNDHFGEFISSERSGEGDYTITIRCPHCSNVSIYKNFHQRMLGVFKLACRNCNQTMSMTPLAFDHVREDYERNRKVFEKIKEGVVPVIVTPCMSEAEYSAMAELYLDGVNIASFMDNDDDKVGKKYLDKTVLKRSHENVRAVCKTHYFLMPLTRFANRIFSHLVSLGVDSDRICRLDEIETGKTSAKVKGEQNG
ncbi:MAG: radical SAM protein, partial [Syntrophales bacterium]